MKKIIVKIILVTIVFMSLYFLYNLINSRKYQVMGTIVDNAEINKKLVALTFDDGPGEKTEEVLDILDKHSVKASFFLTGKEIKENNDKAKMIFERGHEIGNHSFNHKSFIFKSLNFIEEEIENTDKLIRDLGYNDEIYFRPPYCKKLFALPYYLNKNNRITVTWNLEPDSIEEISQNPKKMLNYVDKNIKPGSIILMHVMYNSGEVSIETIPLIIKNLKEKGYDFVTIDQLIKNPRNL